MKKEQLYFSINLIIIVLSIFYKHSKIVFSNVYYEYIINIIIILTILFLFTKQLLLENKNKYFIIFSSLPIFFIILYLINNIIKDYSLDQILKYLGYILCLVVMGIFLLFFKNEKYSVSIISHIGMSVALAYVLSFLKIWRMPQGGSVSLAMIPILLISYKYGIKISITTAYIYGIINFMLEPYIVHPIQIFLDYQLAFILVGTAGYFRNSINKFIFIGIPCSFFMKFIVHAISGVVFFSQYAPKGMNPIWYSIVYNATYIIPETILCIILISGMKKNLVLK